MTIEDDIAFFQRVPTIGNLDRDALRILAIGSESMYVHTGAVLFHAGEAADSAFVLQEGKFGLAGTAMNGEPAVVGPGTLMGELALFAEVKRPVTATALGPSRVMRIPRTLFLKILDGFPSVARRLRDLIANRSDDATRELQEVRVNLYGGSQPS
jgi:CRP-like cAMP-binding protein